MPRRRVFDLWHVYGEKPAVVEAARLVVDTAKDDPLRIYNATYELGLALAALDDATSGEGRT